MKILAIDLGKVKSVACDYESETAAHRFETVRTEPAILEELFRRRCPDRVVIEVGPAAGWVTDLAARMNIELQVANPSHQGWRWRGIKTKTDRVDAVKLAQLSSVNQLPQVELPSKEVREWRSLIHYRQSLVARRTMIKNTIRSILTRQAISMPSGKRAWTNAGRKWLASHRRGQSLSTIDPGGSQLVGVENQPLDETGFRSRLSRVSLATEDCHRSGGQATADLVLGDDAGR